MSDDFQGEFELLPHGSHRSYHGIARAFEPARLTQARVLAELTKAELADAIHVSAAAVGQYEAGVTAPRPELLPVLSGIPEVLLVTRRQPGAGPGRGGSQHLIG